MEPRVRMSVLRELYRPLLTPWQDQVIDLYYDQDWSLAEIASLRRVSRAAVHSILKRAEAILRHYEEKLGLWAAYQTRHRQMDELEQILASLGVMDDPRLTPLLEELRK